MGGLMLAGRGAALFLCVNTSVLVSKDYWKWRHLLPEKLIIDMLCQHFFSVPLVLGHLSEEKHLAILQ